jgi:hypothetical protein
MSFLQEISLLCVCVSGFLWGALADIRKGALINDDAVPGVWQYQDT